MEYAEITPNALGFILVGEGLITRGDLYLGLREHERTGAPLGHSLKVLGLLDEEKLTEALAIQAHCPRLSAGLLPELVAEAMGSRLPEWESLESEVGAVVCGAHAGRLYLAVTDARAIDKLLDSRLLPDFDFGVYVVSESDFMAAQRVLSGEATAGTSEGQIEGSDGGSDETIGFGMCQIGYYEASEALFEAPDFRSLGAIAASALVHFFPNVAAVQVSGDELTLLAKSSPGEIGPRSAQGFEMHTEPFYGAAAEHPLGSVFLEWLGFQESPAILVVCWSLGDSFLVLVGSHEAGQDIYGDLNDVAGLFQEVETALNVLNNPATNG